MEVKRTGLCRPPANEPHHHNHQGGVGGGPEINGGGGNRSTTTMTEKDGFPSESGEKFECAICLHPCEYPVRLPCNHIFCFLCMKGSAKQNQRCALCRKDIPDSCFFNPPLLNEEDLEKTVTFDKNYQWFYEGRNGWWQYDDRTSQEMEQRYKNNETSFDLLIAGYLYTIDFEKKIQYRQDNPMKRRQIKRDFVNIPEKKGIAGIKFNQTSLGRPGPLGGEISTPPLARLDSNICDDTVMSPPAPNNTPQSPANSPLHSTFSSEQDLSIHFENLQLGGDSHTNIIGGGRAVERGGSIQ